MRIRLVCPSKGRPGLVHQGMAASIPVEERYIVVPDDEVPAYEQTVSRTGIDAQVVGCPKKGIAATRNWVLDNLWSDDAFMVFMDDDIDYVLWVFGAENGFREDLTPAAVRAVIEDDARISKFVGSNAFSFSNWMKPIYVDRGQPFKFAGKMNCCIMGIHSRQYRFDENVRMRDDFEYSVSLLFHTGIVMIDRRLMVAQKGGEMGIIDGGVMGIRTRANIEADNRYLVRKYGKFIIKYLGSTKDSVYGV